MGAARRCGGQTAYQVAEGPLYRYHKRARPDRSARSRDTRVTRLPGGVPRGRGPGVPHDRPIGRGPFPPGPDRAGREWTGRDWTGSSRTGSGPDRIALDPSGPARVEPVQQLVGVAGFEPTTFRSQSGRATKLRHTPSVRHVEYMPPHSGAAQFRGTPPGHRHRPGNRCATGRPGPLLCGVPGSTWRRGRSSMVEPQSSKLATRVRFPSPAPSGSAPGQRRDRRSGAVAFPGSRERGVPHACHTLRTVVDGPPPPGRSPRRRSAAPAPH